MTSIGGPMDYCSEHTTKCTKIGALEQGQEELDRRLEAIAAAQTATIQEIAAELKEMRSDFQQAIGGFKLLVKMGGALVGAIAALYYILQMVK